MSLRNASAIRGKPSTRARARAVMVLGCTSGAGKSWIATALCRWYARQGLHVAPFKAQNMSNHARVVGLGRESAAGEIGSAQYFQALAAGVEPEVRMNPVLLKPEADIRSQVILLGKTRHDLTAMPWRDRSDLLWHTARDAYEELAHEYELIVIEGAGSPAEINLAAQDFVNTRTALLARARCLLAADIDRGGAFAHLYGTHQLMDPAVRGLLAGFVLNRFRGDAALLTPGPEQLETLTGIPTVAVIPMMRAHGLPEEDAVPADVGAEVGAAAPSTHVVVIAAPHASNLDEFEALRGLGIRLSFARDARTIENADWLVLPGSKQSRADLSWLKNQGLDAAIVQHAAANRPVLGICGGLQMLGERIEDPDGLEGHTPGTDRGLGLLPVITQYHAYKQLTRLQARFGQLDSPWSALSGMRVEGYEIHCGQTRLVADPAQAVRCALAAPSAGTLGWQRGAVLGVYLHGLFENPTLLRALFDEVPRRGSIDFDAMADHLERGFKRGVLESLVDGCASRAVRSVAGAAPE